MSPVGAIFVPFPPKTETDMLHFRPPPIVELIVELSVRRSETQASCFGVAV